MTKRDKQKIDVKFIVVVLIALTLILGLSFFMQGKEIQPEEKELPDEYDARYAKLVISELNSSNSGIYVNEYNQITDYLELFNGTDKEIDLTGYGLSDRNDRIKWSFPTGTTIQAKSYLTISLCGETKDGLCANFKLSSSGGEQVILTNAAAKVIDGVDTVALKKNNSMVRDDNGNWYVCQYGTPGFENSQKGLQQYIESLLDEHNDEIIINEFLTKNNGNYINENYNDAGFIEIKNISDHSINLANYCLSNDLYVPFKYCFNDITLQANEIYCLYLGNGNITSDNYLGFDLSNGNGNVILSKQGKIIQNINYNNVKSGEAYVYLDSTYYLSGVVSPGYENDAKGIEEFQNKYLSNKQELIINEVMNNNKQYLPQNGAQYYDWIELYNNSGKTINLADYYLADSNNRLTTYQLPNVQLKAGEYYVLMCSGDVNLSNKSYQHTNFKISDQQALFLSKNNTIIDSMFISNVPYGYSYGRNEYNGYYYISKPTPNASNNPGTRSISALPVFSLSGGVYDETVSINISGPGTIYYTLDGSYPTTNSNIYTGLLSFNETKVVKAICVQEGMLNSALVCNSYIVNDSHDLPVLSLSLNPSDYNYINNNKWSEIERRGYIEFYDQNGSFSSSCGVSLSGLTARNYDKKGFNLKFDSQWGASDLVYPVFDNRDNSVYDSLTLRAGSTDQYGAIICDALSSALVDQYTDIDTKAVRPAVLYINGQYWGIYNIREKVNWHYIAEHYNTKDDINLLGVEDGAIYGSYQQYQELINFVQNNNLNVEKNFQYVAQRVNMTNLADYYICEMFVANPDLANIKFFHSSNIDDNKLHYIFYDTDRGWNSTNFDYYSYYYSNPNGFPNYEFDSEGTYIVYYDNALIYNLIHESDQFEQIWLERLAYNLNNTFKYENIDNQIKYFEEAYKNEIERDRQRWGYSMSDYYNELNRIRNFSKNRTRVILEQTKRFFSLTDSQMKTYFKDLW